MSTPHLTRNNDSKNQNHQPSLTVHRPLKSLRVTTSDEIRTYATTTPSMHDLSKSRFYGEYNVTIGLHTGFVLGGILFVTVVYLLYKTKCRKPLRRQFRKVILYMKGAPPQKVMDSKCVGTNAQSETAKGSWICFDNPDIQPSVEIDALKATALWIMQNHEEELQNLHEVSGIILRVDPDVIHASEAREKAAWMTDSHAVNISSTPMSSESCCYDNVPQVLNVPVENHFLQVPNMETPRPASNSPISFARQNRLHSSASHPSFGQWGALTSPTRLFVAPHMPFYFSQPSLPSNSVNSERGMLAVSFNDEDGSSSDSLSEDDPLIPRHKHIDRYSSNTQRDFTKISSNSLKSHQSHKSSLKSRGSACKMFKTKPEQLHELLPASDISSDVSINNTGNNQITNSAFRSQETIV